MSRRRKTMRVGDGRYSKVKILADRIRKLEYKLDMSREPSPGGNPYWRCVDCHVTDPQLSIRNGKHYVGCIYHGLEKEIAHYRCLLRELCERDGIL